MLRRLLFILCALSLLGGGAASASVAEVLGDEGERYRVHAGMAMDLLAEEELEGAGGIPPWNPILALEIARPSGAVERVVVPGTEGIDTEASPALVYDAGQLFLLWATETLDDTSFLSLVDFDGATFGAPVELTDDPLPLKGRPMLSVERDTVELAAVGEEPAERIARTVVHLAWWEDDGAALRTRYAPVILTDGAYVGDHPILDLAPGDGEGEASGSAAELVPTLQRARLDGGAIVTVPSADSGRVATFRMRVLASALDDVADAARHHIIGVGRTLDFTKQEALVRLADAARHHIIGVGRVHPGMREYLSTTAYDHIAAWDGPTDEAGLEALGAEVAEELRNAGASLAGDPLRETALACSAVSVDDPRAGLRHRVETCAVAELATPSIGSTAVASRLLASDSGDRVWVLWERPNGDVYYRVHGGEGWSDKVLVGSKENGLGLDGAVALLLDQAR